MISITLNAVSEACSVSAFIRACIHAGCRGEKSSVTRKEIDMVTSQETNVFCINFTVEVPPFKWLHQCNATWREQKVSTVLIRFPHSRFYLRNRVCYPRELTRCGIAGAVESKRTEEDHSKVYDFGKNKQGEFTKAAIQLHLFSENDPL